MRDAVDVARAECDDRVPFIQREEGKFPPVAGNDFFRRVQGIQRDGRRRARQGGDAGDE